MLPHFSHDNRKGSDMNEINPKNRLTLRSRVTKYIQNNLLYLPTSILIILILGIWILNKAFTINYSLNKFLFTLVILTMISTDILYIWRREMPGPIPGRIVRGKIAIIVGVFELVLLIFIGLVLIVVRP